MMIIMTTLYYHFYPCFFEYLVMLALFVLLDVCSKFVVGRHVTIICEYLPETETITHLGCGSAVGALLGAPFPETVQAAQHEIYSLL